MDVAAVRRATVPALRTNLIWVWWVAGQRPAFGWPSDLDWLELDSALGVHGSGRWAVDASVSVGVVHRPQEPRRSLAHLSTSGDYRLRGCRPPVSRQVDTSGQRLRR